MINPSPLYCCILAHGVPNKHAACEAAFMSWVQQLFDYTVQWVHDTDSEGFPRFHAMVFLFVRQPEGFLEQTWVEVMTTHGINAEQAGSFSVRYFTWDQIFNGSIESEAG